MVATREQARALRRNATPAEKALWQRLRSRKLHDLKFLRQHPIGPFIVDFCCRDRRLIVELDGEVHEGEQQSARDKGRDDYLKAQDYVILRIPNEQVFTDLDAVVKSISNAVHLAPPHWLRPRVKEREERRSGSVSEEE